MKREPETVAATAFVTAAQPGWRCVTMEDDGTHWTWPVLAWGWDLVRLRGGYGNSDFPMWDCPIPLGAHGSGSGEDTYAIVSPDGEWSIPDMDSGVGGMEAAVAALRDLK